MSKRLFDKIGSIVFDGVSKRYNGRAAVEHLDLDVVGGELLILIGPSGSGKTTTLRMINRVIEPDTGTITIDSRNISDFDPVALRRNMGYVIQEIGLFPHMDVGENISVIPRLEGWSQERTASRVDSLLELVDLSPEEFRSRYPRELSGGQQQRIGLARALAMDPPILLMDEPFGALDPLLRKQLQDEFLEIKKEIGRTIIFVTHDMDEAFKLGDRVAIMRDARLVQVGAPQELILEPRDDFVASMVDSDKKFKHIGHLRAGDMSDTIDARAIFDSDTALNAIKDAMLRNGLSYAFIVEGGKFQGCICPDSYPGDVQGLTAKDALKTCKTFTLSDSLEDCMIELKKDSASFAVVVNAGYPVGILFIDEVFLRLI